VARTPAPSTAEAPAASEPGAAPPAPPSWTEDVSGSVPWDQAYVIETPHYVIKTNVQKKYAQRYAAFVEALARRYTQIFQFSGNDFKYKRNELFIYANQREFIYAEHQDDGVGGFYEPWSKRLVSFHGPWGESKLSTLSVLAHEATHQFENLVVRELQNAPVFLLEGLACFFETTEVRPDGDVIVGKISVERLKSLQRAIKANEYVRLRDLIRTPHASFTGFHYGHAWALVHWLIYGPEQKKAQRLLDWYWETCTKRTTTPDDFERGVTGMGYTMDKLEEAWKKWVLEMDPAKDPAQLLYEQAKKKGR
jgi:hypothetical protein